MLLVATREKAGEDHEGKRETEQQGDQSPANSSCPSHCAFHENLLVEIPATLLGIRLQTARLHPQLPCPNSLRARFAKVSALRPDSVIRSGRWNGADPCAWVCLRWKIRFDGKSLRHHDLDVPHTTNDIDAHLLAVPLDHKI